MKKAITCMILATLVCTSAYPWSSRPSKPEPIISKRPQAVGDIVGRDLNVTGLGAFGHVGMWTGSKVMEVLNESSVVQQNSLRSFHNKTKWWGARYNTSIFIDRQKMIDEGWAQRLYNPDYTLRTSFIVGKQEEVCTSWASSFCREKKVVVKPGLWRCDTFVNWSYYQGARVWADSGLNTITPRSLFSKLRFSR